MSFLTQMPIELYADDAAKDFRIADDFDLGTARALAWMSQLAYETDRDKVTAICQKMAVALIGDPIHGSVTTGLPVASTYVMVLDPGPAAVVAFAGTDPVVLANWVSDFDIRQTEDGSTAGFAVALQAVERDILVRLPPDRQIMVTGHSLGGALAVLFAARLAALRRNVSAVYTYGMPRPGRRPFTDPYNQGPLARRTYRLVHGQDIVPTVAPSEPFGFRHVGRYVPAPRGGKVEEPAAEPGSDEPAFAEGIAQEWRSFFHDPSAAMGVYAAQLGRAARALVGRPDPQARTDRAGIFIETMPPRIRDHMPDRYIAACSP
jgi:triacylglycerol lipase